MGEQKVVRARVVIAGLVQGVGFRAYTHMQAQRQKLTGWVRNLHDGRVETEVEGLRHAIELFVVDLQKGPRHSRVDTVDVEWREAVNRDADFHIRD